MNQRSRAACFTTRRLVKGLTFAGVCVLLAGATIGFGPDMPTNTKGGEDGLPPPLRASTATLSAGKQPLGNTKQDGGETIVSTRKATTKDAEEEGDAGPDHGNWLWDTSLNNPRLHTPEFIPRNVHNLLSLNPPPSSSIPLSRTHFQQAVQGIRQCRNVGGGGKKNHHQQGDEKEGGITSPFVLSLGEHLFKQYVEDLQRHKEDQGDETGPRQSRPHRRRRPRLIYNCESNRMGRFCGGMGDRFRGMISTFYLSLLSDRRFELFHPVPVPLQRYLRPHLINWIPTKSREKEGRAGEEQLGQLDNDINNNGSGGGRKGGEVDNGATSAFDALLKDLDTDPALSMPDSSLMRIKGHSVFLRKLDKLTSLLSGNVGKEKSSATDLRIQTNSVGVDSFLMNQAKTPILSNRRQQIFQGSNVGGSSSSSSSPLLPHTTVNLSTYFGCLYEVLFQPSAALLNSTAASLGPEIATITTQLRNSANPSSHSMKKSISNKVILSSSSSSVTTYDSGSPRGGSRMELTIHQPFIGMQVRMGGSWAQGMLVKEPFRTSPEAVDDFFSLVQDVRSASEGVEITSPSTSPSSAKGPWPVFVSSDSERFVQETVAHFGSENVRFVKGGFKHTDTLNFKEAKQSNNNEGGTTTASVESSPSNGDKSVTTVDSSLTQQRRQEYLSTLTNHYILGMSNHIIMAQSGFGDTAFWRSRREASCIFVDMKSLKTAWQHHLSYQPSSLTTSQVGPNSVVAKPMIPPRLVPLSLVLASSNPEWTNKEEEEEPLTVENLSVSQVRCGRTIDVAVKQSAFYSATCPSFSSSTK